MGSVVPPSSGFSGDVSSLSSVLWVNTDRKVNKHTLIHITTIPNCFCICSYVYPLPALGLTTLYIFVRLVPHQQSLKRNVLGYLGFLLLFLFRLWIFRVRVWKRKHSCHYIYLSIHQSIILLVLQKFLPNMTFRDKLKMFCVNP